MTCNYLRLFEEGRLNPDLPEHAIKIEAFLAGLNVESKSKYAKMKAIYDAKRTKKPKPQKEDVKTEDTIVVEVEVKDKPKKKTSKSSPTK